MYLSTNNISGIEHARNFMMTKTAQYQPEFNPKCFNLFVRRESDSVIETKTILEPLLKTVDHVYLLTPVHDKSFNYLLYQLKKDYSFNLHYYTTHKDLDIVPKENSILIMNHFESIPAPTTKTFKKCLKFANQFEQVVGLLEGNQSRFKTITIIQAFMLSGLIKNKSQFAKKYYKYYRRWNKSFRARNYDERFFITQQRQFDSFIQYPYTVNTDNANALHLEELYIHLNNIIHIENIPMTMEC